MFCHMRQMKDTVWLWDGTDWVEQHIGFEMFAAQKAPDMIVPLDLTDITTPTVKIRITSATGLGGPDYVWMDFSDDKIQSITPVNMSSADFIVNGTGVPGAMEKLADDDSNYIVMDTGDYGFLEFERLSPPLQARTFFVESNGYYYYDKWHNIVNMTNETKDFIYSILTDKILAMRYFSPRVFSGCAYGIYLDHSDNAIINNVSGRASNIQTGDECEEYGVYLSTCNYATLTNISLTNWEFGIYLTSSDNNNIMNCNAYNNNEYGIYLYSSSNGNVIYHNNFIDNVQNAYDACSNTWDDGYPSGGNYWSDYSGVDNYSGPGQNISGSDGIGDTPYNITGGSNQDRYPSMAMWDTIPPTITDVQATPAIQNTTEPVNITCTVVDNRDLVDTVKLNITGPEGFTLEVTMNVNGSSYYYENTYTTMGFYYYYIWANDTQGNIAVSDTYLFTITEFDKPISSVDPLPTWRNTVPFTVTATAYDNTGVANVTLYYQYSSNGTEWTEWTAYGTDTVEPWSWEFIGSDGYHKFYSVAVDTQGNVEDPPDVADASTGIDTVPPVTTVELDGTMGDNGWFVSDVEVTLSATDNLSGVSSTWFRIDSGYWTIYTGVPFTVSGEGEYTVQYYSFDIAGNIEDTKSVDIKIDTIPPVTEHEFDGVIGEDGWFVSDVTVTLSAEDQMPFVLRSRSTTLSTGSSGVNYTMYKVDDGEWTTYVDPFVVTEDGEHILYYYSVDLAGNQEETKEADFKIDHDVLPPVTTHGFAGTMGDNGWFVSDVTVTLGAVDISPSGVNHTYYKLDEGEWQEYTSAFSVTEDGVHTLYYYSVDYVGNNETVKGPFDFKIDQTPPTIELNATKIGFMKWLLNATVFDETSGIAKVEFYVDGEFVGEVTEEPYEWVYSGTGNKARAIVYDNAGNEALSKEVTPYSQGQSQSISSSSASSPLGIFSWLFGLW